jgi:hypothetical protein
MNTIKQISKVLNGLLETDKPEKRLFDEMIRSALTQHKLTLQIIDLRFYDEKRLKRLGRQKLRFIMIQDFENAASVRDLEKECSAYIDMRKEYKIVKSRFELDDEFVFYIHLGTSPNDYKVKRWFNSSEKQVNDSSDND